MKRLLLLELFLVVGLLLFNNIPALTLLFGVLPLLLIGVLYCFHRDSEQLLATVVTCITFAGLGASYSYAAGLGLAMVAILFLRRQLDISKQTSSIILAVFSVTQLVITANAISALIWVSFSLHIVAIIGLSYYLQHRSRQHV